MVFYYHNFLMKEKTSTEISIIVAKSLLMQFFKFSNEIDPSFPNETSFTR